MANKNKKSLEAIIATNATAAIETAKSVISSSKETVTNQEVETSAPIKEEAPAAKPKKVTLKKKAETKKEQTIKEAAKQQKASIIEEVTSKREVKYIYPEDVVDTLARKKWRQQTRNELHRLELQLSRIKDTNSKEYKKALKEFTDYKKKVLKEGQAA